MRPAGLAEVERAKADGRRAAAYDGPATAVVPDDLAAALAVRHLTDIFAALDSRNRFAFLNRIHTAVRPETRTRRIEQLTDALAQGRTPYPPPRRRSATSWVSSATQQTRAASQRRLRVQVQPSDRRLDTCRLSGGVGRPSPHLKRI